MKTLHTVTDPAQYPPFWNEEWLQLAINELDKRALSPEELLDHEMTLSANALAIKNEQKRIDAVKKTTVGNLLQLGILTVEQIANSVNVPPDFVLDVQKHLIKGE